MSSLNFFETMGIQLEPFVDGHTNMARDLGLLERAELGRPGCRVYSWEGPWISLGRFQQPERDLLDLDLVPWVMRSTGGKAVLHGHDVTVGLAVPLGVFGERRTANEEQADEAKLRQNTKLKARDMAIEDEVDRRSARSVKAVYRALTMPLIEALNACGLEAALAENTAFSGRGPRTADCFAHISPNDIVNPPTGLKVCGCALKLTSRAVLLQASIPNGPPLVDPARLFVVPQTAMASRWNDREFPTELTRSLVSQLAVC